MDTGTWVFGLLAIGSILSIAAKRPWTMVFARLQNSPEVCQTAIFRETNMVLTCVWSLLFIGGALLATVGSPWLNLIMGLVNFSQVIFFSLLAFCHAII